MAGSPRKSEASPHVGLFVTCLVDLFRPSVGHAAVKLLEQSGCRVSVPEMQTCCGQPAYNSGDRSDARALAAATVRAFEPYDYVVAPSGSCAGMLKHHYPDLLGDDEALAEKAQAFCAKVHELMEFLVDIRGMEEVEAAFPGEVTYHDSCAGLREMGVKEQPRRLLVSVKGLTLKEMEDSEVCCGFGGTFSIKYPEISNAIVGKKTESIAASGADCVLAGDLGCLMNMAGKLAREGKPVRARHVAEVLAGMTDTPPITGDER
ncbi:MAG: (Fe-S)-binding protein [Methyloligellaceae bacterium]